MLVQLETQSKSCVQRIRTDNGTEYVNGTLGPWLKSKGIVHEKSAPYTPEQNGRAERLNRTLMERARAMLSDSGVSKFLWPEAVLTANYLRNRSPVAGSSHVPLHHFSKSKPSVSHLRVFGCPVAVKIPKPDSKVSPYSTSGVFLGYDLSHSNYRVYLPLSNRVVTTADVKFYENSTAVPPDPDSPESETVTLPDLPEMTLSPKLSTPPSPSTPVSSAVVIADAGVGVQSLSTPESESESLALVSVVTP